MKKPYEIKFVEIKPYVKHNIIHPLLFVSSFAIDELFIYLMSHHLAQSFTVFSNYAFDNRLPNNYENVNRYY